MTEEEQMAEALVGTVVDGKFTVDRVLGVGGMAVVVAARPLSGGDAVAIKLLRHTALTISDAKTRFFREANTLALLTNRHVLRVFEVGQQSGSDLPYMTMELLEGMSLGKLLRTRGPLPVAAACSYIVQACEALAEAHSKGIIHRDLKPENLFLHEQGPEASVKVIDFGIAKELDSSGPRTEAGAVMGSVAHMPPEQLRAAKYAEQRSDIWALGATLFELLTGQRPFQAPSLPQLVVAINCDPPRSARALRPDLPAGLEAVMLRCMEKKPEKRFSSMDELAAALRPFASGEVVEEAAPTAAAEPEKTAPAKADLEKTVLAKAEPAKGEPAKAEPAKAEPAKAEPAKGEPAKAEQARVAASVKAAKPAEALSAQTPMSSVPVVLLVLGLVVLVVVLAVALQLPLRDAARRRTREASEPRAFAAGRRAERGVVQRGRHERDRRPHVP